MPLDFQEIIEDGGDAAALVSKIKDGVAALPTPLTATAVCGLAAAVLPELGALADKIAADVKD